MNHFLNFIIKYNNELQLLFFIGLIFFSWNVENALGIITNYKKWKHASKNVGFIFTNLPGQFILGLLTIKTIH